MSAQKSARAPISPNLSRAQNPTAAQASPTQKPPLVLLHGLFGSPLGLAEITQDLRDAGYTVFVPAIPPFAGSETAWDEQRKAISNQAAQTALDQHDAPSRQTAHTTSSSSSHHLTQTKQTVSRPDISLDQRYADYLRTYLQLNQIENPVLIGHSMGTLVATSFVRHYPELGNEKLILLSPISTIPNFFIAKISVLSAYLPPKLIDWITTRFLIIARGRKNFRKIIAQVHACSLDHRPSRKYIREATKFSTTYSITKNLLNITHTKRKIQILLLPGEHDRLVPLAGTRQAAEQLNQFPGQTFACECVSLPETGHLHNYEKPHETVQQIIKFLES